MTGLEVSAAVQLRALVLAVGLGILLGLLFDAFFILRVLLGAHTGKRGRTRLAARRYPLLPPDFGEREQGRVGRGLSFVLTLILDFFYATMGGILFLLFVYSQSEGVFRLYYLIAAAFGFFCYYQTLGRLVGSLTAAIVFLLHLFLAYILLFIRVPFLWLLRVAGRSILSLALLIYRPLYGACLMAKRKICAGRAFLPPRLSI
ncbi:MAG: hypothetical protein IJ009_05280 [Clostridia bacterium]|nr:hypothetical protein [Clostridia bacterium]